MEVNNEKLQEAIKVKANEMVEGMKVIVPSHSLTDADGTILSHPSMEIEGTMSEDAYKKKLLAEAKAEEAAATTSKQPAKPK